MDRLSKNTEISNLTKIRPAEAQLFRVDRYDDAKRHFSQLRERA